MESWRGFLKEDDEPEEEPQGEHDPEQEDPWEGESQEDWIKRKRRQVHPGPGDPGYEESFEDPGPYAHAYYDPEAKSHDEPMSTTLGDVYSKEGDPDKLDDTRAEIEKRAELKKGLEDKLGGMTRDEIRKHVDDLTAGIDFGDVSDEQYVESVIWAILHPEEAKGDAPKSTLGV